MRTKAFGGLAFAIDRPKGTLKEWPQPDGSVKRFIYPCDYGYLRGHAGEDGEPLDFFVGDAADGHLESFQKLARGDDGRYRMDETKFLVGVTDAEREAIYRLYGPEVWHRRTYATMDDVARAAASFRRPYGVRKEAGLLDGLGRAFDRLRGRAATLHAPAPHPPALHPALPPTRPSGAPAPAARAATDALPPLSTAERAALAPTAPPPASAGPGSSVRRRLATPDLAGLRTTGNTPVQRTSRADMLLGQLDAAGTLKDLRVRAALGAGPAPGGGVATRKPAAADALADHLLRTDPGAAASPEAILKSMKTPEYAALRARYKGASAREAALAHYGFKGAGLKRADIEKRVAGEVLVASPRRGAAKTASLYEKVADRSYWTTLAGGLLGAPVGAAVGYYGDKDPETRGRSALIGGAVGGLALGGLGAAYDLSHHARASSAAGARQAAGDAAEARLSREVDARHAAQEAAHRAKMDAARADARAQGRREGIEELAQQRSREQVEAAQSAARMDVTRTQEREAVLREHLMKLHQDPFHAGSPEFKAQMHMTLGPDWNTHPHIVEALRSAERAGSMRRAASAAVAPAPAAKTAGFLNAVSPSLGAALDAFDAERQRQDILEARRDALRYPAAHYTQPVMQQYAMGGGDLASAPAPAPTHHHRRHHHHH